MKHLMMVALVGVAVDAFAVPTISEISVTQDPVSRLVTVTYTLSGAPAIVTAPENCVSVSGDINRRIDADGTYTAIWQPESDLDGQAIPAGTELALRAWDVATPPPYMAVQLDAKDTSGRVWFYCSSNAVPLGVTDDRYKTNWLLMRRIPAKDVVWRMGSPDSEPQSQPDEATHYVKLTKDYYMGVYPVTRRQWEHVRFEAVGQFQGYADSHLRPAEKVWKDHRGIRGYADDSGWPTNGHAVTEGSFLGKLRARTAIQFDLPTEAQWEFACRAGCGNGLYTGKDVGDYWGIDTKLYPLAWFGSGDSRWPGNAGGATHPVGLKLPNAFGLYDMLGNVFETCLDNYSKNLATALNVDPETPEVDPVGPAATERTPGYYARVLRGGGVGVGKMAIALYARAAARCCDCGPDYGGNYKDKEHGGGWNYWDFCPYVGFRVACPVDLQNW